MSNALIDPFFYWSEWNSPVFDSRIETHRVERKLDKTITKMTVNGTQRNAPTMPQSDPQTINAMMTVRGLKLRVSPITFGSTIFPMS